MRPNVVDKTLLIKIDRRSFIVYFDETGKPSRIRERKKYGEYPIEGYYDTTYWSPRHPTPKSKSSLFARIIAATEQKKTT